MMNEFNKLKLEIKITYSFLLIMDKKIIAGYSNIDAANLDASALMYYYPNSKIKIKGVKIFDKSGLFV
mgnify:CR=1 FL=1